MPYSPSDPPEEIAANIAAAFAARAQTVGVKTVTVNEAEALMTRDLPAIQMFQVQTEINNDSPLGHSEWAFHWRLDLYVRMKKYVDAQAELNTLIPRLLRLPRAEMAAGFTVIDRAVLDGTCNEWTVFDEGDDPNPDNEAEVLYKGLRLRAVALTVP